MNFIQPLLSTDEGVIALCIFVILFIFVVIFFFKWRQEKAQSSQLLSYQESHYQELVASLRSENQIVQNKLEASQGEYTIIANEYTKVRTTLEEKEKSFADQIKLLMESKAQLTLEFESLANQIFEAKGKIQTELNKKSMMHLLQPFREQLHEFKQRVEHIYHDETVQKTALKEELLHLKQLNAEMSKETQALTTALKGNKKVQGNWGELVLENLLETAGLTEGRDFSTQYQVVSQEGERQIPDVVIHLPQDQHLIIDSKVSMNAYIDYVNNSDEDERARFIKQHCDAIKTHVKTLSAKQYGKAKSLHAPELVVMFIPIESAFIAAVEYDPSLLEMAIHTNILITTPSTLLASLNVIRQLWRMEKQNENVEKLAVVAAQVYDKFRLFLESMENIEKGLDRAKESFMTAKNQLVTGRGNLLDLSQQFLELGVSVKKKIEEKE